MSEGGGILQQFNINELAGATGLILGALGGILAIIFKSRCYCRLNLCYICFCERKPPPDSPMGDESDDDDDDEPLKEKDKKGKDETDPEKGREKEDETLIPAKTPKKESGNVEFDITDNEEAIAFVEKVNNGRRVIPTLMVDGISHTNPGINFLMKLIAE